jgi:A/G-specific adenine glycosylase
MHDTRWKSSVRRQLLDWFDNHQRDLPWRRDTTPYRVWVSEIMLQQTQVATVIAYYDRFLQRFPTVNRLAAADQSEVLKLWEGLGYYRRARQLHAAARIVVEKHRGNFPTDFDSVVALPGIGRYTAGAILSISRDQRLPVLEGNTIRLFARLLAMQDDPRTGSNQKTLWEFSESLLPKKRCGDFNQALMELGSEICRPNSPACTDCPLQRLCPTFVRGLQKKIPVAAKKLNYESVTEAVVIASRRGKYLVRQCGEGERWTGLWDFPRFSVDGASPETDLQTKLESLTGLTAELCDSKQTIKHAVTRFRITLNCFVAGNLRGRLRQANGQQFKWLSAKEMDEYPMSVTGRKIADRIRNSADD